MNHTIENPTTLSASDEDKKLFAAAQKRKLTELASQITATKWCSYHQGFSAADKGRDIERNRRKRWMCGSCLAKRKLPPAIANSPLEAVQ
jgi:hypothetical protein